MFNLYNIIETRVRRIELVHPLILPSFCIWINYGVHGPTTVSCIQHGYLEAT